MARILVVDDSSLARRTTRRILEEAGHEITEAEDGLVAIERFYHDKPDIVVLDVTMKDMDGIEVLERLRQMDSNAKVIIATADVQDSTQVMAREGGAAGFVVKPIVTQQLLEAINDAQGKAS